jgi:hypothetical protein
LHSSVLFGTVLSRRPSNNRTGTVDMHSCLEEN